MKAWAQFRENFTGRGRVPARSGGMKLYGSQTGKQIE